MANKDYAQLRKRAVSRGWAVEDQRKHLKWTPPAGQGSPIFSSKSPSDYRAIQNHLSLMRQRGWVE